jgi:hypothetical protein
MVVAADAPGRLVTQRSAVVDDDRIAPELEVAAIGLVSPKRRRCDGTDEPLTGFVVSPNRAIDDLHKMTRQSRRTAVHVLPPLRRPADALYDPNSVLDTGFR